MKLNRLKSWYTLAEASTRLSLTLDEPITENDVIQLASDGSIAVSWFLSNAHEHMAKQVTVSSDYPCGEAPFITTEPVYDKDGKSWGHFLTGIFTLPVDLYPPWGWWLLTFLGKGGESGMGWDPIVIDVDDGAFWAFYDRSGSGEFMHFPAKDDVVITCKDIEAFERRMCDEGLDTCSKDAAPAMTTNEIKAKMPEQANWKMRIQAEAKQMFIRGREHGSSPTVYSIKNDMAKWCRDNDVKTTGGIFPSGEYLRVHVLSAKYWTPPA